MKTKNDNSNSRWGWRNQQYDTSMTSCHEEVCVIYLIALGHVWSL